MSVATAAGILLIALPVAFNAVFAALAATFDYPDILRRPTAEVLERFNAGGTRLIVLWWVFALTAVALAPLAVLVSSALYEASVTLRYLAAMLGVLAALVQFLGIIRWPFLVPYLARVSTDPDTSPAQREAVDVVFQSFNRYLGVAVGEHLGYLFTGGWSVLAGLAMTQSPVVPIVARGCRDGDWRPARALLAGVRRAVRTIWVEGRRHVDPDRVRGVVNLARCCGHHIPALIRRVL